MGYPCADDTFTFILMLRVFGIVFKIRISKFFGKKLFKIVGLKIKYRAFLRLLP